MNKNVKRIFLAFLCVIMIFSLFTVIGFAENDPKPTFRISTVGEISVGKEISVLVSAENLSKLGDANVKIKYDNNSLEFVEAKNPISSKAAMGSSMKSNDGTIIWNFYYYPEFTGKDDIALITFKVLNTDNLILTLIPYEWSSTEIPDTADFDILVSEKKDPSEINVKYEYKIENGEVSITDCSFDSSGDIVIPETIEGYPVTIIKEDAFTNCDEITSIVIPDSVKTIEKFAFSSCNGLINVTIGSGVKTLGRSIFWACSNLESVVIKNGVTYISEEMFSQCPKLNSVILPDSITSIGDSAFEFCYLLTEINIPKNVKTIGKTAFYTCISLNNVVLPDSITEIAEKTFYDCKKLTNVTLSKNLKTIGISAFVGSSLENVDIPSSVTNIEVGAFAGTNLKKVVIPNGIKSISHSAFENCKKLTEVVIPDTVESIGRHAFAGCSAMKSIKIPESVKELDYRSVGYDNGSFPIGGFEIYGVKGSAAESYALSNRINFVDINPVEVLYDVNGDGNVSASDARLALRASARLATLGGDSFTAADVNRDGNVTASDARLILRKAAKLD